MNCKTSIARMIAHWHLYCIARLSMLTTEYRVYGLWICYKVYCVICNTTHTLLCDVISIKFKLKCLSEWWGQECILARQWLPWICVWCWVLCICVCTMIKDHVIEIVLKHWGKKFNYVLKFLPFSTDIYCFFTLFFFMKSTLTVVLPFSTIQMMHSVYIVAQLASNFTIHYSVFHFILLNKRLARLFQLDNYTLLFSATFDNNRLHVINYYYYNNVVGILM